MLHFGYGPEELQSVLAAVARDKERREGYKQQATPQVAESLGKIHKDYPFLPPGVKLAFAKKLAMDPEVSDLIRQTAEFISRYPEDFKQTKEENDSGGAWGWVKRAAGTVGDFTYDVFTTPGRIYMSSEGAQTAVKGLSRVTFAAGQSGIDLFQNAASDFVRNLQSWAPGGQTPSERYNRPDKPGRLDILKATTAHNMIQNWSEQGSGYFPSEKIMEAQGEAARQYRGVIGESAWSLGRAGASVVARPGTMPFNVLSGAIDAAAAFGVGRVNANIAKGIGAFEQADDASAFARKIGQVTNILRGEGAAIRPSLITGDEFKDLQRTIGIVGGSVDPTVANKWLGTLGGRRFVRRLAEANTFDEVRQIVGRNVFPETVIKLRDAKTEFAVQTLLTDILGQAGGITRTNVAGAKLVTYPTKVFITRFLDSIPGGGKIKRAASIVPQSSVINFDPKNPLEARDTVNNIDDWLKLNPRLSSTRRSEILDKYLDSLYGPEANLGTRQAAQEAVEGALEAGLAAGNSAGVAKMIIKGFRKWREQVLGTYHVGETAIPEDGGLYATAVVSNNQPKFSDAVLGGASLESEILQNFLVLPDPRVYKALTNKKINWLWRSRPNAKKLGMSEEELDDLIARAFAEDDMGLLQNVDNIFDDANLNTLAKAGQLRFLPYLLDDIQRRLFKQLHLATIGYSLRNLTEAQYRLAMHSEYNASSMLRHPFDYIAWVSHKKGAGDIFGDVFDAKTLKQSINPYRLAVSTEAQLDIRDQLRVMRYGIETEQFQPINRAAELSKGGKQKVVLSHGDELGGLNADPVARLVASGLDDDEIIRWIQTTDEGKRWFADQQYIHFDRGRAILDKNSGKLLGKANIDLENDLNLRQRIVEIRKFVDNATGGRQELRDIIAFGQLPAETIDLQITSKINIPLTAADEKQVVTIPEVRMTPNGPVLRRARDTKKPKLRQVYVESVDEAAGTAVVKPFAFIDGEITDDAVRLLSVDEILNDPNLSNWLVYRARYEDPTQGLKNLRERWDKGTAWWFSTIYGKPSSYLDRSPLFRQRYWAWVDQTVTSLSADDAKKLVDNAIYRAGKLKVSPEDYVGGKELWNKLNSLPDSKFKGTMTLEQLDSVVKGQALDDLKGILYTAADQRNFVQAFGVVAPFANAFFEFYKTLGKLYTVPGPGVRLPNIASIFKTAQIAYSGQQADWDNDGKGMFYEDPVTGEWSFNYPFSAEVNRALTKVFAGGQSLPGGIDIPYGAPIAGALQGFDFGQQSTFGLKLNPGLGPFASIPASFILRALPVSDEMEASIKNFALPYGEIEPSPAGILKSFTPAWIQKVVSAWDNDSGSISAHANTVSELTQLFAASGDYDLSTKEGINKMLTDVDKFSPILTTMRAIGQFIGPSRPEIQYKVGDVFVEDAIKLYREWREEDYDTAFEKLLNVYGKDFLYYMAGKSTSTYNALGVSTEFGVWEKQNGKNLDSYPLVYAFLAPVSTTLDYNVYLQQFKTGRKERLTPRELIAANHFMIVSGLVDLRRRTEYGKELNKVEEADLKKYKEKLIKQYPGYNDRPFDPKERLRMWDQLYQVANLKDEALQDNPVYLGLRAYLQERYLVVRAAQTQGYSSLESSGAIYYRNKMRQKADAIIKQYPEFDRIFKQLLDYEVNG